MAQKRMFDKRVVSSDKFIDLPHSSKALYFMAGMEADDKGFFQPRKIQRMCGFNDDDFKILIAKGYFIPFDSGVMVVTDWNKNNWLDSRRINETEYIDELNLLKLINDKYELDVSKKDGAKQMLSEYSIEENSIEENNIIICSQLPKNGKTLNAYEQEFEELWKLYPKKQGKKDAFKHYIKARKEYDFEVIKKGLNNYNSYIKRHNMTDQYIKNGSTWFNQECWNDEYDAESNNEPYWLNQNIKEEKNMTQEEQKEMNNLFKEFY